MFIIVCHWVARRPARNRHRTGWQCLPGRLCCSVGICSPASSRPTRSSALGLESTRERLHEAPVARWSFDIKCLWTTVIVKPNTMLFRFNIDMKSYIRGNSKEGISQYLWFSTGTWTRPKPVIQECCLRLTLPDTNHYVSIPTPSWSDKLVSVSWHKAESFESEPSLHSDYWHLCYPTSLQLPTAPRVGRLVVFPATGWSSFGNKPSNHQRLRPG